MGLFVYFVSLQGFDFQYLTLHGHFVLRFRGVMSFDPMGLPRFERVLDSYAFCHSVISTRVGTFAAGICDFVTFFVSTNASGN